MKDEYCQLNELLRTDRRFRSFRIAVDAAIRLTAAADRFCREGGGRLQDGEVLVHPEKGRVRIEESAKASRDLDAIPDPGSAEEGTSGDRYALAVLISRFLAGGTHPMAGRRSVRPVLTREMKRELFQENPLFMFDPDNDDNRPDPKLHQEAIALWMILPDWMKDMFLQVFSARGLKEPEGRPSEMAWAKALIRFQNRMLPCRCGNVLFDTGEDEYKCDRCGREITIGYRIETGTEQIPAVVGNRLYHLPAEDGSSWDPDPIARLVGPADEGKRTGIQNISGKPWEAITTKGEIRAVDADEVVPVKGGIRCLCDNEAIQIIETNRTGEK